MIEGDSNRGEVLQDLLQKEQVLSESDAGRAFEGVFQLLCDQNRSMEFREQLRSLLGRPASKHLRPDESRYLGQLMRELTREDSGIEGGGICLAARAIECRSLPTERSSAHFPLSTPTADRAQSWTQSL